MHEYWMEFSQVALAHLLAVASPGPDFALVLKQSLLHGRRTALWTSSGIALAILVHVTYSLLGVGLLVRESAAWFRVVRYAGAAYIAWLGVQSLRSRPRPAPESGWEAQRLAQGGKPAERGAFATGFLTNVLNPKATLFFIALFAMVVSPRTPKWIQLGYGLWMVAATAIWFGLVSVLFAQPAVRRKFLRHGHWVDRAMGVVFLALAFGLVRSTLRSS